MLPECLCDFRTNIIHVTWMFMWLSYKYNTCYLNVYEPNIHLNYLNDVFHKIKKKLYILFMFLCLFLTVLLEWRSGQTKDDTIGPCSFYAKHATLRRKSKDWLARNHDNVSEWGDMSVRGLLFQWASTIIILLSVLV